MGESWFSSALASLSRSLYTLLCVETENGLNKKYWKYKQPPEVCADESLAVLWAYLMCSHGQLDVVY